MDPITEGEAAMAKDPEGGEGAASKDPQKQDPRPNEGGAGEGGAPKDPEPKEGTVNRSQYDADIRRRDKEIADLRRQLEEGGKAKKSTEDRLADLERKVAERERELADERANSKLAAAGCVDLDLGRAALAAYDGDVAKLKEAKPFLFSDPQQPRSTGGKPAGRTPDDQIEHYRRVAGLKK